MNSKIDTQCSLKLKKMVFDKILFERVGFKNDKELGVEMRVQISENKEDNIYKVSLGINGDKEGEYRFQVQISGFFSVYSDDLNADEDLINKNAVAILMPYIRSEISLITAQPETECVVLPPFNIENIMRS